MNNINLFWARESTPSLGVLSSLLKNDVSTSLGCVKFNNLNKKASTTYYKSLPNYEKLENDINLELGSLFISNHRYESLQENDIIDQICQPLVNQEYGLILSGTGEISNKNIEYLKTRFIFKTDVNNEAIIWEYINQGKNIEDTVKALNGEFSCIMLDVVKNKLYLICKGDKSLYYGYVKGYGLIVSSIRDSVYNCVSTIKNADIFNSVSNIWEDYYCSFIDGDTMEIDLDSGSIIDYHG